MTIHSIIRHIIFTGLIISIGYSQDIVIDYDGNEYHSIAIGDQVWLQENIESLHYSDGTEIPGVVAYGEVERNSRIYGRLYTWDATMRNETGENVQGICPDGWHVPSNAEWGILEDYLGGASVAGGKLKATGTLYWSSPNMGADNSSGFSALPGGEYDGHYSPHIFQLLHEYAVFWTSTEVSTDKATERYLAFDNAASSPYNWYKSMKYSVRAIQNSGTSGLKESLQNAPHSYFLYANMPNPFNPETTIPFELKQSGHIRIEIFDIMGQSVKTLLDSKLSAGVHQLVWHGANQHGEQMDSGVYIIVLTGREAQQTRKISLVR
ncbi:MAG: T9SS type A sorting domain-containing protein [Candidatus Marinimicrobia bacterium]|nr:T9SS type A sorting domain-containing protein [Candidatus Neomarinimicrobiota bacterium]